MVKASGAVLEPDEVAGLTALAIAEERFLDPAPSRGARLHALRKATDIERWLAGMRRLNARFTGSAG